jgi:hypothetical protein
MFYTWLSVSFEDGGEILISADTNGDCIHDNIMDSTIAEGGIILFIKQSWHLVH